MAIQSSISQELAPPFGVPWKSAKDVALPSRLPLGSLQKVGPRGGAAMPSRKARYAMSKQPGWVSVGTSLPKDDVCGYTMSKQPGWVSVVFPKGRFVRVHYEQIVGVGNS